jgi:hypothetical protein
MIWKRIGIGLLFPLLWISCNNDDDNIGLGGIVVPPREFDEVAAEDEAEIEEFLQTHFYNYEEFETPPADFDYKIRIDTIAGDNADKTPLIDQVESEVIRRSASDFGLEQDSGEIPLTLYYLTAKRREPSPEGLSPTIGDSVLVRYVGAYLDGKAFDATPNYVWQELPFFLRGYQVAMTKFISGSEDAFFVNTDGTSGFTNNGIGMMIFPSGLGYYNDNSRGVIPYSPLIFTVDLGLVVEDTDSDNDGIPSYLEDVDGSGDLFDDNTDEEVELNSLNAIITVNFLDSDDDGDGTPTRDEIEFIDGELTFPDSDGDGTPDYLDPDTP